MGCARMVLVVPSSTYHLSACPLLTPPYCRTAIVPFTLTSIDAEVSPGSADYLGLSLRDLVEISPAVTPTQGDIKIQGAGSSN